MRPVATVRGPTSEQPPRPAAGPSRHPGSRGRRPGSQAGLSGPRSFGTDRPGLARGGFLRGEREKLQKEMTTLRATSAPQVGVNPEQEPRRAGRPPAMSITSSCSTIGSPIINLERLMELTRADAQVRIRMSDRAPVISNKVGPVGAFSLEYELVRRCRAAWRSCSSERASDSI